MIQEPSKGTKIVTDFVVDLQCFASLAVRMEFSGTVYTSRFTLESLPVNIRVHHSERRAPIYI
jgi:hypothetical protein